MVKIFLLWFAGIGAASQFAKMSAVFPELQAHYPDAGATLGWAVSLISFLGIGLGLFAGVLVGRFGFKRMLVGALALGAAASLLQALLPSMPLFLMSRVIEGASHLTIAVAAPTLMARIAREDQRAFAMTLWSTFFGISFALFALLGPWIVAQAGLAAVFLCHGLYMAAIAVLVKALLTKDTGVVEPLSVRTLIADHIAAYRAPHTSAVGFGWLFYTLTYVSVLTVLPATLAPEVRATASFWMPLAGIIVSFTLGLWFLRRLTAVSVVVLGFGLGAAVSLGFGTGIAPAFWGVALIAALGLVQGASFAAIPQLCHTPRDQALANGVVVQMGNLGNTIGTPILLAIIASFGTPGLVIFLALSYLAAALAHLVQRQRRARLEIAP